MSNKLSQPLKKATVKIEVSDLFEAVALSHELYSNLGADVRIMSDHIVVKCFSSQKIVREIVDKIIIDRTMSIDRRVIPIARVRRRGAA